MHACMHVCVRVCVCVCVHMFMYTHVHWRAAYGSQSCSSSGAEVTNRPSAWRPLVLLIPLRLGLTDINEAYVETLKVSLFHLFQCVVS